MKCSKELNTAKKGQQNVKRSYTQQKKTKKYKMEKNIAKIVQRSVKGYKRSKNI